MDARDPSKKQTLLRYLERGVAMVHLDARRPGVTAPPQYRDEAHLRLNLSYRYAISDFEIGDEHVQATLSFGGKPFQCILPWTAIFGITSHATGDGQVWPEDLPTEVVETLAARKEREQRGQTKQSRTKGAAATKDGEDAAPSRPTLVAVAPAEEANEDTPKELPQAESPSPSDGQPRRHLRLVR